jgi:heat shock protein HtpX
VGGRRDPVIAVSDGLLRTLNRRELIGVFAHEVSHIANHDLWIMSLADIMSRVTSISSYVRQFIVIVNLPLILIGSAHVPWTVPLILVLSPTIMSLLQLALSRTREFQADLTAARLTWDPRGLASALVKLERSIGRFWEEILLPGRRIPNPSLLRTHPKMEERVRRLMDLVHEVSDDELEGEVSRLPIGYRVTSSSPRWHRTGVWY